MSTFIPTFFVMNRQGRFLAKNPKTGRNQLPGVWTAERTGTGAPAAESFASWEEAAAWGRTLPPAVQPNAAIVDQNGRFWSADDARKAKVFSPPKAKPASTKEPAANNTDEAPADQKLAA